LVLNKIDSVPSAKLLELAADLNARCPFETTFMISALKGSGVGDLLSYLVSQLPEGPWLYPEDQVSDVSDRDLAAEIVREKLFLRLHQELPYHLSVVPESWREQADGSVRFEAIIYVERDSHRMIVLGEKGAQIKAVGQAARLELAAALGRTVHLFLHVKVQPKWTQNAQMFKKMGLDFSDT
jgi:GTP-binding protein Era